MADDGKVILNFPLAPESIHRQSGGDSSLDVGGRSSRQLSGDAPSSPVSRSLSMGPAAPDPNPRTEGSPRLPEPEAQTNFRTPEPAAPTPVPQPIPSQESTAQSTPPRQKMIYEIWPGNNTFCCFGRLMVGPRQHWKYMIITWALILAITAVYSVFAVPAFLVGLNCLLPVFSTVFFVASAVFYFLVAFSDPGIIPRKEVFQLAGSVPDRYTEKVFDQYTKTPGGMTAEEKNHVLQSFKYCSTCKIFRPPRASHCAYSGSHLTRLVDIATTASRCSTTIVLSSETASANATTASSSCSSSPSSSTVSVWLWASF